MKRKSDKYANFVDHPRYGRRPKRTGLNPDPSRSDVNLHWNTTSHAELVAQYESALGKKWPHGDLSAYSLGSRIPDTAVEADLERQTPATIPVTHYFDLERTCRDCNEQFIFFAEEQKYWYEELGFGLESDCVRCVPCRKHQQGVIKTRDKYENLFHMSEKTDDQKIEMAECCLELIESEIFTVRQTQRVRGLLNSISPDATVRNRAQFTDLYDRVRVLETAAGG